MQTLLQAKNLQYTKGHWDGPDAFKEIGLRLLPTWAAVHDSVRMLLLLTLMDGVFENGISTWADFAHLRPRVHGTV